MKASILFLIFIAVVFPSFGQMSGSVKDFAEFEKRPLIVLVPETVKEKEMTVVKGMQENLKSCIKRFWKVQEEITFMTSDELNALKKNKSVKSKSAIMRLMVYEINNSSVSTGGLTSYDPAGWFTVSFLDIGFLDNKKEKYFYRHNFLSSYPAEAAIASALLQVQQAVKRGVRDKKEISFTKEAKANSGKLKELTLLLDRSQIQKGLTNQEIEENYGLKYKIVETKEFEEAILNQTPGFAYVYVLPITTRTNVSIQLVLATQDTEIISVSMPPKFKVLGTDSGTEVRKGNLKEYVSYMNK